MEKIGNKELVYSKDFIVPEGEDVDITHNLQGWDLKIKIKFDQNAENQSINLTPVDDHALITFQKWDSSLGSSTANPAQLGTHNSGRTVYFSAASYCIGGTNKLTFQLLMGGKNEE